MGSKKYPIVKRKAEYLDINILSISNNLNFEVSKSKIPILGKNLKILGKNLKILGKN